MRLFTHKNRPVHLGALPTERLGRADRDLAHLVTSTGLLRADFPKDHLGRALNDFLCALDAVREGPVKTDEAEIPADPTARAQHLKAAGYFLDATLVGATRLTSAHVLESRHQHPDLDSLSFQASKEKLRLRFNPHTVIKQMEQALALASAPIDTHDHAFVIINDYPRDPVPNEPGSEWITGLQPWRAAVRAAETAVVLASYLRILGFEARAHTATTSDVNLHKLAVAAGLALPDGDEVSSPFIGNRFQVAAVTTTMRARVDRPLRVQTRADRRRSHGLAWRLGLAAPKTPGTLIDMAGRPYQHSRYPTETLTRVETPTTFIDEERIPRVPKSSEMFLRGAFGDLGKPSLEASKDGYSVAKAPLAHALRLALNVYSLLQRGDAAPVQASGYDDPDRNAAMMKAAMHFLGADLAGVSAAPPWVWYSHRQDGSEMEVAHDNAVSVMIDQGFETMDGASGDDWISAAQSMRTYMRAALVCGVLGLHLRNIGFPATAHSAADSDVIQTPLVLIAGLGEVSRIGETILNPFLGPRLKTGILTTDFPMRADKPIDFGLQKFCENCNKCARECPSGAITTGGKVMFNGYEIWKADTAKCTQYRVSNMGGAMCGRCMKTCPWNLEGLFAEKPFQWAARHAPWAAKWLAVLDDKLNRGSINPVKKWWWDIALDQETGRIGPATQTNARELSTHIKVTPEDQTLAMYPIDLAPPPLPMPHPLEREAAIQAYDDALTPRQYLARLNAGKTDGLVGRAKPIGAAPPVFIAQVARRRPGSADGKIDIFEITAPDGAALPPFTAGAHVDIMVTPQYVRQFSLAGDPADRSRYLLGILREDDGRGGSLKIHQLAEEGAPVVVSRPRNHFPVHDGPGRHILMAGGIGVTPLIAMGHELARAGRPFTLYYKARTRAQAAFIGELEAVSWRNHVKFHFSDEDRLDIATVLNEYQSGDHVYTCGPAPFMDAVFQTAAEFGWPEDSCHREFFSVPEAGDWENTAFEIELASSGQVLAIPEDRTITEVLSDSGVNIDVKCSDGLCGVCTCAYSGDAVEHRDYVLSKAQRAEKMTLCCSRAAMAGGRITLEL